MSENGRKRCRKTKLVPRDCGDDDDCFLQEPARKKSLLEKIKTESNDTGTAESSLQFSVKVEVEDIDDTHPEEDPSDYMKYLFSLSKDTSQDTEPTTDNTVSLRKSTNDGESRKSTTEESMPDDHSAYLLDPNKMYKMFPILHKKFPNDKEAVMHCRNLWGKAFYEIGSYDTTLSIQDCQLHNIIMQWKAWQLTSKTRESPFCYKCYICNDAWWSYSDFRNHIRIHPTATLKLEVVHQECNIIVYEGRAPVVREIFVDGKCFKCAKTFKQHQENKVYSEYVYTCVHCKETLQTCTAFLRHSGICDRNPLRIAWNTRSMLNNQDFKDYPCKVCKVVFLTKPAQLEHLSVCHTVRSDDPIVTGFKTCKLCNKTYYSFSYHVCSKKNVLHACKCCGLKFQSKQMLDLHMNVSRKSVYCSKCDKCIEKSCMAPEHYARHSDNFQILNRCLFCKKIILFGSDEASRQHRIKRHTKIHRSITDKILIPKMMLEQCKFVHKQPPRPNRNRRVKVQHDTVNLYNKVRGKSYRRRTSRRNTEEHTDEEEDVDVETNDPENKVIDNNVLNKIKQITESIDIKPDIVVKQEKFSDDEDVKPDINTFLEETAASSQELESCTDIKLEQEKAQESTTATQEQKKVETGQANMEKVQNVAKVTELQGDQDDILKEVAIKVEQADPEEIQKEIDAIEAEKTNNDKIQDTTLNENVNPKKQNAFNVTKLSPCQQKAKDKIALANSKNIPILTKMKTPVPVEPKQRILNQKMADIFNVSESILDPVTVKLEIKAESEDYDNDLIILHTSDNSVKQESSSDNSELGLFNLEPEVILNAGYKKRKVYKCSKCDYSGFHKEYREHITNNCVFPSKEKPGKKVTLNYACTKCNSAYPCLKKYAMHFIYHGYKYMKCPQCPLVFDTLTRLMPHLNSHIKNQYMRVQQIDSCDERNSKSYQCKSCKEVVPLKHSFEHWEKHLELYAEQEKDENAVECEQEAKGMCMLEPDTMNRIIAVLQQHTVSNTGLPQKIKTCLVCHRNFERQNDCKRHLIEHLLDDAFGKITNATNLQCQICKDILGSADTYKKHMRDHAALPIYKCSLCNKTFSDSSNFTKHKKIHNAKAFVCDICNKKFQAKISLEKHIQMHMETDPYTCETCERVFYDKAFFKRHMRQYHDKLRSKFKCMICRDRFDSLRLKWDHMWLVHKQRKEAADCPICKKSYRKISDVKKHCQLEHMINLSINNVLEIVRQFSMESEKVQSEQKQVSETVESDDDVLVIEEARETLVIFDDDAS